MTRISTPTPPLKPPLGERDHTIGPANARLMVCEYGDFQCPHCRKAWPIVKMLIENFGDELLFGYRHFPLGKMHPLARAAAEAAEAAGAQNKFWEMHDLLFENQKDLDNDHLIQYATTLGLDLDKFRHDLESKAFGPRVQEDLATGIRSGVNGTPTFFVQNQRFNGGYELQALTDALKAV